MLVTVEVTQKDINQGVRDNCSLCPVARAVKRVAKYTSGVQVEKFHLVIHTNKNHATQVINLPGEAIRFIGQFDKRAVVHPFSFQIELPNWVLKLSVRNKELLAS